MPERNNHPSLDAIMEFASLSGATLERADFGKYFQLVSHFTHCEKCRTLKDNMVLFSEKLDYILSRNDMNLGLKLKIYCSLESLDASGEWKNQDVLWVARGKVLKDAGRSELQTIRMDYSRAEKIQTDDNELEKYSEAEDNHIVIDSDKIEVSLKDDGKDKHSVLIIPQKAEQKPMLQAMEKSSDQWQMSCMCSDDDYDIVIF